MKKIKGEFDKEIQTDVTGSGEKYIVYALIKFGQEKYLKDFLNKGILYFSSKSHLRGNLNENSDDFRYDSLEGATLYESHTSGADLTMHLPSGDLHTRALKVLFTGRPVEIFGNISSFYAITDNSFQDKKLIPVDGRMKQFGSHFILIYNFERFLKRVTSVLDRIRLSHSRGLVEYFDELNHKGELHYFHKRSSLDYQKEYRIDLKTESTKPFILKLGNLSEFATVCHSDTLESLDININSDDSTLNVHYLKPTKRKC